MVKSEIAAGLEQVQLLVFRVADEEYVVDIMRVNEIIRPENITRVRKAPEYVRGVIELREQIVPILDLRARLSLEPIVRDEQPYVIIVTVEGVTVGLEVDRVVEVVRVERQVIKPSPNITSESDGQAPFFLGVCPWKDRLLMLLNIKRLVLTRDQVTPESWVSARGEGLA